MSAVVVGADTESERSSIQN